MCWSFFEVGIFFVFASFITSHTFSICQWLLCYARCFGFFFIFEKFLTRNCSIPTISLACFIFRHCFATFFLPIDNRCFRLMLRTYFVRYASIALMTKIVKCSHELDTKPKNQSPSLFLCPISGHCFAFLRLIDVSINRFRHAPLSLLKL